MKIGIVGSSGYISSFLMKDILKDPSLSVVKIDQVGEYDLFVNLENAEEFDYDSLIGIDIIIFTAAISGPDKCAQDFDFCWSINVKGTEHFISNALNRGIKVLFFSSDAVFGIDQGIPFDENSLTNPRTAYGKMKQHVENSFKENPLFKAIRLSYVLSDHDRFTTYCINCINNNEEAEIFHPFYRNVINVNDVATTVIWFIYHWGEYEPTFLNIAGEELVSRIRIADEINRVYDNQLKYRLIEDESFFLNREKTTQTVSLYLEKYHIIEEKSFSEKFRRSLKENKKQ